MMRTFSGTYHNGQLKLDRPLRADTPVRVKVIVEDEPTQGALKLSEFSFLDTQELLKNCSASFAEEVEKERRSAV